MSKARVRGLERIFSKLGSVLKASQDRTMLSELGSFSVDRIVSTTKSGRSLVTNARLLPLKKLTIKIRKWWKEKGKPTGRLFSPRRSNLTLTGQMLDAVQARVNEAQSKVSIFVAPTSRPIKGPALRGRDEDRLTNEQVARKVAQAGRPFMGMDATGKRRMVEIVKRKVRDRIKQEFK